MQARNHENSDEICAQPVRHLDLATPAFYHYRKNPKCYHTVWGKKPPTFHYTGWLVGILTYNQFIIIPVYKWVVFHPLDNPTNHVFLFVAHKGLREGFSPNSRNDLFASYSKNRLTKS